MLAFILLGPSLRSRQKHKPWGVSPRYQTTRKIIEPAKRATELGIANWLISIEPIGNQKSSIANDSGALRELRTGDAMRSLRGFAIAQIAGPTPASSFQNRKPYPLFRDNGRELR